MEEPLLAPAGGGFTIRYKNRSLYSPVDPHGGVLRRIAEYLPEGAIAPGTLVFIPSPALGYGLRELLDILPPDGRLLCVEVDARLLALCGVRAEVPLPRDPRLIVVRASEPDGPLQALRSLGVWRFRRVRTLVLSGGYALHREAYEAMREALEGEIRLFWQNKMTLIRLSRLWVSNLFENLPHLPASGGLGGLRTTRPILVVGAGPSLQASLEWIHTACRFRPPAVRPLVGAVDTALPVLREAGVQPDLVFLLEAQAVNLQDFIGWTRWTTPLICDLTAHPTVVRWFGAAVRFFASRFAPVRLLERLEEGGLLPPCIPPLGSVGVAALHLALEITRGPVIVAGLDFSYPGGRTHAPGAPSDRLVQATSDRFCPAGQRALEGLLRRPRLLRRSKSGDPLLTDVVLLSYARQLSERVRGESRVYDIGAEGLPLGAARLHSLRELQAVCTSAAEEQEGAPAANQTGGVSRERVRAFLEEELRRLADLRRALRSGRGSSTPGLSAALRELDYLFLHFAEADPEPELNAGSAARVLLAADYYHRRLERLLPRLRGQAGTEEGGGG